MCTPQVRFSMDLIRAARCASSLLAASLWIGSIAEAASVTATKDCLTSPCTVVEAQFTILVAQTIQWEATYSGTATQGHSFYLSKVSSNLADIALTTTGQSSGSLSLAAGTYHISIRLALMGPGAYTVTYNPSSTGEPHITTIDGTRYDFQGAGEFVLLRHPGGIEIQTRHAPIATTSAPGPDPYDDLVTCVSINTAVAARVGTRRVTYEPHLGGAPDSSGLQLRVDGAVTALDDKGVDLGNGGRITRTAAPGGLEIDFPGGTVLFVTPGWWVEQGKWYLNLNVIPAQAMAGIMGVVPPRNWLPALPDGGVMGPMPTALHDRFVGLYQKFAEAWRVTDETSLFDYAPGTSTATFTLRSWPPESPPCRVPGATSAEPASELIARQACQKVIGENARCVFDVMATGNAGFASTYVLSQSLGVNHNRGIPSSNRTLRLFVIGFILVAVSLVLLAIWWRVKTKP
jgi:hypothetical protein